MMRIPCERAQISCTEAKALLGYSYGQDNLIDV